jgi:hypothetical protein
MKVIALTYDYDLSKLAEIGRKWAPEVYGNKDFIFEYSAASYATFLDKNPTKFLHLYTDDIDLIKEKLNKYTTGTDRVIFYDITPLLEKYKDGMKYSFDMLTDFIYYAKSNTEFTLKIDNDLVFHSEIPEPETIWHNVVYVWKYERMVYDGDPRMGEIKVAQTTCGNLNFPIYNLGVLGLPIIYPEQELRDVCNKMVDVDISDVSDLGVKIWHCAEQTANNYIFKRYGFNIVQTDHLVTHYYDNKQACIKHAEYLLKK